MKKIIQILSFVFLVVEVILAQYNNKQWVFGYQDEPSSKLGLNCLDFTNHEIKVYPYEYQNGISWT